MRNLAQIIPFFGRRGEDAEDILCFTGIIRSPLLKINYKLLMKVGRLPFYYVSICKKKRQNSKMHLLKGKRVNWGLAPTHVLLYPQPVKK